MKEVAAIITHTWSRGQTGRMADVEAEAGPSSPRQGAPSLFKKRQRKGPAGKISIAQEDAPSRTSEADADVASSANQPTDDGEEQE